MSALPPCVEPLACLAPPNRGSFNSTHVYGTRVPVEEPSTASKADIHRLIRSSPQHGFNRSVVSAYLTIDAPL
jgi:hypothetical protein